MPPNNKSYQSIDSSQYRRSNESKDVLPLTLQQSANNHCNNSNNNNNDSRSSYNSDNNGDENDNFTDFLGNQMRRRPVLILCLMLLLACTLGHTATVVYYWDDIKSSNHDHGHDNGNGNGNQPSPVVTPLKTNGNTSETGDSTIESILKDDNGGDKTAQKTQNKKLKKAQLYADEQKKVQLDKPSLESEKYYNHTLSALLSDHEDSNYDDTDSVNDKHDSRPYIMGMSKSKKHGLNSQLSSTSTSSSTPPPPPPYDCQATIMIIRHCEKGDIREHCNIIGFERAKYIATLFGDNDERWPSPHQIYALSPGGRHDKSVQNMREIETVTPLSEKVNVSINDNYGLSNIEEFTSNLFESLRSGDVCNKMILISWKHDNIPNLAMRLGCGPNNGCPTDFDDMDFDSAWQIRYVYRKEQYATYPAAEEKHKKKKHKPWGLHPIWWIFGKVEKEGFDPLAFDKESGTF